VEVGIAGDVTRDAWERMVADVLEGDAIVRVIAPHAHPDHLGLAHWFTERYGCPLWMTQGEYLNAHAVWNDVAGYGSAALGRLFAQHGLEQTRVDAIVARGNLYRRGVPAIPTQYRRIMDGEHIRVGAHEWRVIT